jgi:hypothetical protein
MTYDTNQAFVTNAMLVMNAERGEEEPGGGGDLGWAAANT